MNARTILALLVGACAGLAGCNARLEIANSPEGTIALADQQRHKVMLQTREASYSVFPDTDDAKKLEDKTILDAMHAETPNGSAFAVRADGLVLTNVHVIEGTNFCTGQGPRQGFGVPAPSAEDILRENGRLKEEEARRDGTKETHCLFVTQSFTRVLRAKLIKIDRAHDVAVLCLLNSGKNIPFLELSPMGGVAEGMEVLTIGSPLGNMNMLTHGYVSNLDYTPQDKETGKKGVTKVQFTAPILPGNSGGPLVSISTGKVVGQVVEIIVIRGGIPTQMSYANTVEDLRGNIANVPRCDKK